MSQPDFWQDRLKAEKGAKQLDKIKQDLKKWLNIEKSINDCLEIAKLDKEDQTVNLRKEIEKQFEIIKRQLNNFEKLTFLDNKYDQKNALLSIFAGAGGVDAQDWAEMLLRMYLRYSEKKNWRVQIIDHSKGIEAGMKSVTIEVEGDHAYGFLKNEAGVHRLVRISPFDAEKMRHTSFAMVDVLPEMKEIEVEIKEDELRIDTFLSSGPGGQNVQKNETAIRIVHLPTNISAVCQSERYQSRNKEKALEILKSKLYQYKQTEKQEEKDKIRGEFKSVSWGNQIRSYVLHPYHLVKDMRTNFETDKIEEILNGNLEEIIESLLRKK